MTKVCLASVVERDKKIWCKLGIGRSIGAPMHRDTKFDDIPIDTHNH